MYLTFVIPDVNAFQSGGNIYNKKLIEGLQQLGYPPTVMELAAFKKVASQSLKGIYFFDTLYLSELTGILKNKNSRVRFFLIVHHLESLYPPENWNSKTYFNQKEFPYLIQFNGFLTSSQFTSNYLIINNLHQQKITLPPAIDFTPSSIPNRNSSPINGLMVANLVARKGVFPFLKKLANSPLTQQANKLQIHLIGANNIEKNYGKNCLFFLKNNAALNKIVQYHGQLSSQDLLAFYWQTNLFISTSLMETYGMALQEARTFCLPILALEGGNVHNHVENHKNGWISTTLDELITQLAHLVRKPALLENVQSRIKNKPASKFYNWKTVAQQFLSQLRDKTGGNKASLK